MTSNASLCRRMMRLRVFSETVEWRNERRFDCTREEGVGSENRSPSRDTAKVGEAATLERQACDD